MIFNIIDSRFLSSNAQDFIEERGLCRITAGAAIPEQ